MKKFNPDRFEETAQELQEKISELASAAENLTDPECYSDRESRRGQIAEIQAGLAVLSYWLKQLKKLE